MNPYEYLGKILNITPAFLERLDAAMGTRSGKKDVFRRIAEENETQVQNVLAELGIAGRSVPEMKHAMKEAVLSHEKELVEYLQNVEGATEFEKAANLAKRIAGVPKGFFLKREYAKDILRKHTPENLLAFLGHKDVEELFSKTNIVEAFSALRFIESDAWMHETFERAYSSFSVNDFEEREVEIRVLGPEWEEIAKKFVAKKHHNVSHLKEFGVIFLNPIKEDMPGKFVRDFALLLHYFHEIEFYSKLFKTYSKEADFSSRFKAFLRGDVREVKEVGEGEWLIVQRYLFKEDPSDPRLFLPRVNPESMHWARGERNLAEFAASCGMKLKMWRDHDWVARSFDGEGNLVSFDLEDNAMSAVSALEGRGEYLTYHQREAMWTKIFMEYAGGEGEMERLLLENFDKGMITF